MEKMIPTVAVLVLVGSLCPNTMAQTNSYFEIVRQVAENLTGNLPCATHDCECAYNNARGCCCVAGPLFQLEKSTFIRMVEIQKDLASLSGQIKQIIGERSIAFAARLSSTSGCFGPFNKNVSISYQNVSLNHGYGYNPAMGIFTAPHAGLYSFTYTCYSNQGAASERIYHRVQLMKDTQVVASSWEDNREDSEDSATQTSLINLRRGNQVYVELGLGRFLCADTQGYNSFSGYMVYPFSDV